MRTLLVALSVAVSLCSVVGKSLDEVTVKEKYLAFAGEPTFVYGLRAVNMLWSDEVTQNFLRALPELQAKGVNCVGVNLQGGSPGFEIDARTGRWYSNSAFRSDGSLKPEYMERLRLILDKTRELGMAVNVGYFYQRQCRRAAETPGLERDHWDSEAAILRGVANATEWLRPWRHVFIDVANEFGHEGYQYDIFRDLEGARRLVRQVKAIDPRRVVGVSPCGNVGPLRVPEADIWYTHGYAQCYDSEGRPQVNNEQWCRDQERPGVYSDATKWHVKNSLAAEMDAGNAGWFWHSAWCQYRFQFLPVGNGTDAEPGDGWFYQFLQRFRWGYGELIPDERYQLGVAGCWPSVSGDRGFFESAFVGEAGVMRAEAGLRGLCVVRITGSAFADTSLRGRPRCNDGAIVWADINGNIYIATEESNWCAVKVASGRDVGVMKVGADYVVTYRGTESGKYVVAAVAWPSGKKWTIWKQNTDRSHCYPVCDAGSVVFRWDMGEGLNYKPYVSRLVHGLWTVPQALTSSREKIGEVMDIDFSIVCWSERNKIILHGSNLVVTGLYGDVALGDSVWVLASDGNREHVSEDAHVRVVREDGKTLLFAPGSHGSIAAIADKWCALWWDSDGMLRGWWTGAEVQDVDKVPSVPPARLVGVTVRRKITEY